MKLGARWGDRTPVEVRELVAGDGRVLAWCAAGEGGFAAATDERLRCSDPELDARWPQILGAAWDAPMMELTLWGAGSAAPSGSAWRMPVCCRRWCGSASWPRCWSSNTWRSSGSGA